MRLEINTDDAGADQVFRFDSCERHPKPRQFKRFLKNAEWSKKIAFDSEMNVLSFVFTEVDLDPGFAFSLAIAGVARTNKLIVEVPFNSSRSGFRLAEAFVKKERFRRTSLIAWDDKNMPIGGIDLRDSKVIWQQKTAAETTAFYVLQAESNNW